MASRRVGTFLARDWAAVAGETAEHWRAWKRRHGAAEAIRLADEMRRQVIAARPGWPSAADRLDDLRTHIRVAEALRLAGTSRRR